MQNCKSKHVGTKKKIEKGCGVLKTVGGRVEKGKGKKTLVTLKSRTRRPAKRGKKTEPAVLR